MHFELISEISQVETIATGSGIRDIARLRRRYGSGRWRKRKGVARVRLVDGSFHLAEVTGMKRPGSDARNSSSRSCFRSDAMPKTQTQHLVVCVDNEGYGASLEKRKIYVALPDAAAEKHGLVRVIDESGEDYLFPKGFFRPIALSRSVRKAVLAAA